MYVNWCKCIQLWGLVLLLRLLLAFELSSTKKFCLSTSKVFLTLWEFVCSKQKRLSCLDNIFSGALCSYRLYRLYVMLQGSKDSFITVTPISVFKNFVIADWFTVMSFFDNITDFIPDITVFLQFIIFNQKNYSFSLTI